MVKILMSSRTGSWLLLVSAFGLLMASTALAKFYIESCLTESRPCKALLGYRVMADTKISNVVAMFGGMIDTYELLGANNFQISIPEPQEVIIQADEILRIPVSCACFDGIRRTDSIVYSVRSEEETLQSICDQIFSGMVTPGQIVEANSDPGSQQSANFSAPLAIGQRLVIPFPCACNGGSFNGIPSVFISYMARRGETALEIAEFFDSSVSSVVELNSIQEGSSVSAGDMLEIPIPACTSSFDPRSVDFGLMVPNLTYAITANGCVQCHCGYSYPRLYCAAAPPNLKPNSSCAPLPSCNGSNLKIGQMRTTASLHGCQITSCEYAGFEQQSDTIFTGLESASQSTCPAPIPPPTYRQYMPALTPDASPIIEPQSIVSSSSATNQPDNTTGDESAAIPALTMLHLRFLLVVVFCASLGLFFLF